MIGKLQSYMAASPVIGDCGVQIVELDREVPGELI
jgi:hypothetical protein